MVKLTRFDRLFFNRNPLRIEEAIVKVDCSFANQIISEEQIVVECLNH